MRTFVLGGLVVLLLGCGAAQREPVESAPVAVCPIDLDAARAQGGVCFQPSVLGAATVDACEADVGRRGWGPDEVASAAIGEQMGEPVRCWHAP